MRFPALLLCLLTPLALMLGACGEGPAPAETSAAVDAGPTEAPRLSGSGNGVAVRQPLSPSLPVPELPSPKDRLGGVAVQVVGADGTPLPGAAVTDRWRTQTTDEHGRASVGPFYGGHGMPSQCRAERTITVHVDGFEPVTHICAPGRGSLEIVRVLDRGSRLSGRCVDSKGRPLSDVTLWVEYEEGPRAVMRADADGRFHLTGAARKEGRLRIRESGWTCRPLGVVPPQEGIELVAYRTAWIHGRFDATYERGHGYRARLYVDTNQGWKGRLPHDKPFSIPCCPGEVVLRWDDVVLGRFAVDEGEVLEGVVMPVDITSRTREAGAREHPYVDLDVFHLQDTETFIAAFYEDLGVRRLGYFDGKEEERVRLRSKALRWLSVEPDSGAWRVPASAGARVRIERPPRARITFRLLDARGRPVREGWGEVRWAGTLHAAGHAYGYTVDEPLPPGAARSDDTPLAPGVFRSGPMGTGAFDIAWRLGQDRESRLLCRGVVMPDPPLALDLGDLRVPDATVLRVRVTTTGGGGVPYAIVRLVGRSRHVAARADGDGVAVLRLTDPVRLVLEAEAPNGWTGQARVGADEVQGGVTIRLDREPR